MTKEMLAYEDTLKDIEKPSWKSLGEIDRERIRFLLSTDEMIEEMLSENQGNIVPTFTKPHAIAEAAHEDIA